MLALMPADLEACVSAMTGKADNPYALCNWMKSHGKGFFAAEPASADIDRAVQEFKDEPRLARVRGVEIFKAGTFRGQTYTPADLDVIAANFQKLLPILKPPAVLGHEESQDLLDNSGIPAAGWTERVWREGDTLFADFADVPPSIAKLINGRAYRKVSAEIYDDFADDQGNHHGLALRRVAFLGGELPQIKSLADLPLAEYAEKSRRADLQPVHGIRHFDTNSYTAFCEVHSMSKKWKKATAPKSDKAKLTLKKFADEPAPAEGEAPAVPPSVTRQDMLSLLGEMGFDVTTITDAVPDNVLAEIVRVIQSQVKPEGPPAPMEPAPMMQANEPIVPASPQLPIPAPVAPQHPPSQVTIKYGEKDVQLSEVLKPLIDAAVTAATKPITEKLTAAEQSVEKFQESQKKLSIDARLNLLVEQGKVLPAEIDAGLKDQLYRADAVKKFSDGQTELDKQLGILEARPVIVKLSERVKSGKKAAGSSAGDDEVSKVRRFAEEDQEFTTALKATGKTAADYVASFEEARKKNPNLTAAKYGVPTHYLN